MSSLASGQMNNLNEEQNGKKCLPCQRTHLHNYDEIKNILQVCTDKRTYHFTM